MNARKWFSIVVLVTLIAGAAVATAESGAPATGLTRLGGPTWVTEIIQGIWGIDIPGPRNLALDAYGHPHVVFGKHYLYYAHNDGSGWQIEIVDSDSSHVALFTSLALGPDGRPHIAYHEEAGQDLMYARFDGTAISDGAAWHIERVDSVGAVGSHCSIAVAPNGRPQISYYDETNQALKLAWYDETGWHNTTLDELSGFVGIALVLDANGLPHILYAGNGVRYAYADTNKVWHYAVIDDGDKLYSGRVSLALDSAGQPHMAYLKSQGSSCEYSLFYTYRDGGQWQTSSIDTGSYVGYPSLALDSAGRPHIAFVSRLCPSKGLGYAYYDGSAWQVEDVLMWAFYPSIAVDPAGRPHIFYLSSGYTALMYARLVPPTFADPAFETLWQRADRPVASGYVARSWIWGDRPLASATTFEPYADAPNGSRLALYFDKSRMEINTPNGDRSSPWFVTNGLLVSEMVGGFIQVGDHTFENRAPAGEAVAGDAVAGNPNCPLYSSFTNLVTWAPNRTGQPVTATLTRDGTVGDDPSKAAYAGTQVAYYDPVTNYNVPAVFWSMMNQRGLVYVNGKYQNGLVVDWLFAMGRPIREPYWTRCTVAGVEQDVLVQLFERRVLTYTPANPAGWQVEMGNVGRHYYTWRYGAAPQP